SGGEPGRRGGAGEPTSAGRSAGRRGGSAPGGGRSQTASCDQPPKLEWRTRRRSSGGSDGRVQKALRRQGPHVNGRDVGCAEQTLDDRVEVGLVGDDRVVFVVHGGVGAVGAQDARPVASCSGSRPVGV